MSTYLILFAIIAILYFVLIRNKPAPKTDWEKLPCLHEYQKLDKAKNEQGELCCRYCGATEFVQRVLKSPKENPNNSKHYHACTQCKVILWRSESDSDNANTAE